MSEETVIRCCAPTLAAIKTGSLFNCSFESREELTESLRMVNRCLIRTSEQFTNLTAQDIVLTVGDDCFWIGGITGYAGGYPVEELGMPVTVFTNCVVRNVTVKAGENVDGVGDIVGSGFYSDELAANGAPFDQPTQYELVDCTVENLQPV